MKENTMKMHKQHAQRIGFNHRYRNRNTGKQKKQQQLYSVLIEGTNIVDTVLPEVDARIHNMLMNTMTRVRYQVRRFGSGPSLSTTQLKEALTNG